LGKKSQLTRLHQVCQVTEKLLDQVSFNDLLKNRYLSNAFTESVNSDPMNSPLKHSRANSKDKVMDAKDDFARIVRDRNRPKEKSQIKAASQSNAEFNVAAAPTSRVKSMEIPPETPVPPADDLFSPGLSEPSAPRADSRDTPPPPELGPDTGTGSFGRASRRPKGNVNYAQPNLRDKMRRPTAELVDAVAAEERARQANIAKAEKEASKAVVVKQEDATEGLPVWKTNEPKESHRTLEEPASPLSSKTGESSKDLPSTIITERRRRTNVHVGVEEVNGLAKGTSGAASAIVALTSGSHRPWRNEEERAEKALPEDEEKHEPTERPSIYDFTGSSPNNGFNDEEIRGNAETAKPTRSSRRHSTVAASSDQSKGTLSISRRGDRRRESVLGGREERQDEGAGTDTLPPSARTKSVLQLRDGGEESAMGRGERAASRRRSMML